MMIFIRNTNIMAQGPQTPPPAAKVHLSSEISVAVTYLSAYRDVYPVKDLSESGLVYLLIGFQNYLAASGGVVAAPTTGSAALATLKAGGYV